MKQNNIQKRNEEQAEQAERQRKRNEEFQAEQQRKNEAEQQKRNEEQAEQGNKHESKGFMLNSGKCITTTDQRNKNIAMDASDDMKGLSAAPQHIKEKEEYYQYHNIL